MCMSKAHRAQLVGRSAEERMHECRPSTPPLCPSTVALLSFWSCQARDVPPGTCPPPPRALSRRFSVYICWLIADPDPLSMLADVLVAVVAEPSSHSVRGLRDTARYEGGGGCVFVGSISSYFEALLLDRTTTVFCFSVNIYTGILNYSVYVVVVRVLRSRSLLFCGIVERNDNQDITMLLHG